MVLMKKLGDDAIRSQPIGRMRQLDGLRGVASVVVLLHHSLLLSPAFAATYMANGQMPVTFSITWWLTATPLKLFTAGGEAVLVFFVLSGIVLTLPVLDHFRNFDFWAYFPRRIVRLWLPTLAAVVVAALCWYFVPKGPSEDFGYWVNVFNPVTVTFGNWLTTADLFGGNAIMNSPIWSLHWELLFSLLLPIFVGAGIIFARRAWVWILFACVVVGLGVFWNSTPMRYLPLFLIGAIIAVSLPRLNSVLTKFARSRWSNLVGALSAVCALALVIAYWLLRPMVDGTLTLVALTSAGGVLGAVGFVLVCMFWLPAIQILNSRLLQWLGRISFSLYLVHVPIAFALINLLGAKLWPLATMLTVTLGIALAVVFNRFVDVPSHLLSKRLGAAFSQRMTKFAGADDELLVSTKGRSSTTMRA
ncbi:acyltransferase family protein [Cryobacterium aureum]|uniref:acyltransferase family protein n=1 Tax=Cryobacterium aureum TaxID=995037 RepID=UPI000CF514FF|nr:acyltransferase [Cryobacterium aureum]